jgi:hypothetical protein
LGLASEARFAASTASSLAICSFCDFLMSTVVIRLR